MTTMANASIELESVGELALPETIDTGDARDGVREALRVKRLDALERARARVIECREDVADVRADFGKLADVDRYFASSGYSATARCSRRSISPRFATPLAPRRKSSSTICSPRRR